MEINNNIEENYCSLEVSRLLKEKGFKVPVQTCYDGSDCVASYAALFNLKNYNVGGGKNTSRPTHDLAMKWIRTNLNWHFELIWDIENGETVWFYALSQVGDLENKSIDTPKYKTPEEATEAALLKALGQEPVDPTSIKGIDYNNIKDIVLEEYAKGNIVVAAFDDLQTMPLKEFVKQPVEGMLYDLNRSETVVLTFIKDQKWINDYAVCKVIQELKKEIDELKAK